MAKKALVTGITGQDGAYLSHHLLREGYEVIGAHRPSSTISTWRLEELGILDDLRLESLELLEFSNILRLVQSCEPDEIYNLAAQSFVQASFEEPIYTSKVNAIGVARLLECIRDANSGIRFYQASTSEMFGNVEESPQDESTRFVPSSPYAISKLYAHWMTGNYRDSYDLFAVSGILFNHESPLRGAQFVTRKITTGLAEIKVGREAPLELGNLDAKRDWGHARDYVRGMWKMLQQPRPDDYVLATGEPHSVREFVEATARALDFELVWEGEGLEEEGIDRDTGQTIVRVNEEYYRPTDVHYLQGNCRKARSVLNWNPEYSFEELVEEMVERDLERVQSS